jgi:DNA-directed RNA polymerase subunit omega
VKIENVIDNIGNRFATVVVAARRARQINAYYTGLGSNEGKNIPPQVNSLSRKPLTIAMEEIANGLVEAEHQEEAPPAL